eukprot:jgi/Ulvmu1/12581/UM092_0011.1
MRPLCPLSTSRSCAPCSARLKPCRYSESSQSAALTRRRQRCEATRIPRRGILATGGLLALQNWDTAQAFDFLETKKVGDETLLNANDFELMLPPGFVDLGVPQPKKPAFSATPGAPPPASPIKARYGTPGGGSVITVIVREASAIKPTFTQLQDISAWGNGTEVAQLLLPAGTRLASFQKISIPRPPRDTRTVRGVVEQDPLSIYRYTFQSGTGVPVDFVVAAQKGRVYAMAAQTAPDADEATAAGIRRAVETFRCKEEFKPLY